ncbi:MAG: cation-translocating P-type ATPase [Candidatus Promineifilaceae bacterium]
MTSMQELDLYVGNLDCDHDAAAIERGLTGTPGLDRVKIYPKSAKVSLSFDPAQIDPEQLRTRLDSLGFPPQEGMVMPEQPRPWRNPKVITSVTSGILLSAGWILGLTTLPTPVSSVSYALSIAIGGYYFGREAIEGLIFERRIGVELLMSVAAITAALMGQPAEAAMLVFLYSISEAAEGYTEEKTRASVRALMDLAPKTAIIVRDGVEVEIPAGELAAGDLFIVFPGQSIPTDGVIISGRTSVNQAPITGESLPVEMKPGDTLLAGSLNGEGSIEVEATKAFSDNSLSRIINMVEEAQERKGKSQRFIERFGNRYSPVVLVMGILIAVVPPLFFGGDWTVWVSRATVFIVAAAPCALVISIPVTMVATLGTGARQGVLIKGGKYVEELARIKVVALDKTGTITLGKPEVTEVIVLERDKTNTEELVSLAAGIERRSEHPLAQAILQYARDERIEPTAISDFRALTGVGAQGNWQGNRVYIGNLLLFNDKLGVSLRGDREEVKRLENEGQTVVALGDSQSIWGLIALRDQIRPTSVRAVDELRKRGISHIIMLTGDNEQTANVIARESQVDTFRARLTPEDKVVEVRKLAERYGHVAMVGDGVNDAPALAAATVGVAMGAAGTDVALETADVALMGDDLERLVYGLDLSRRSQSIVRQNLLLSILIISTLSLGAVLGMLTLPMVVIGHELSEILVIANGMRMLRA